MPTACEPWPGKTNASVDMRLLVDAGTAAVPRQLSGIRCGLWLAHRARTGRACPSPVHAERTPERASLVRIACNPA